MKIYQANVSAEIYEYYNEYKNIISSTDFEVQAFDKGEFAIYDRKYDFTCDLSTEVFIDKIDKVRNKTTLTLNHFYHDYDEFSITGDLAICIYTENYQMKIVFNNIDDFDRFENILRYYQDWLSNGFSYKEFVWLSNYDLKDLHLAVLAYIKNQISKDVFDSFCEYKGVTTYQRRAAYEFLKNNDIIVKEGRKYKYNYNNIS